MTNLLGRLAAQAAGAQPEVVPRQRSRFEPDPATAAMADLVEIHEEVVAPSPWRGPISSPPPSPDRASSRPRRLRAALEREASGEHASLGEPATSPVEQDPGFVREEESRRASGDSPDDRAQRPPLLREEGPVLHARAESATTFAAPAAGSRRPLPSSELDVVSEAVGPSARVDLSTANARPETRSSVPAGSTQDGRDDAPGIFSAPAGALVSPPRPERPSERASPPAPPERDEPALGPEIYVSIGRLEVRAPERTPAPAPATPAPGSPGLGLSDYLRERSEGSRP